MTPQPPRRAARDQHLPAPEAEQLNRLPTPSALLFARCRELFASGWTLRAIGEALDPPRSRSTISYWLHLPPTPTPAPTALSTQATPIPLPPAPTLRTPPVYEHKKKPNPGIHPDIQREIAELAPIARKFRSGMTGLHPAAQANARLTVICRDHFDRGVPVQQLAEAANMTYRAMNKRLGRA